MITIVQQLQAQAGSSYRQLIKALELPRSSYLRWKQRMKHKLPMIGKTPARDFQTLEKTQPDVALALKNDIAALHHGQQRTQGTGALYRRARSHLSRRAFNLLVRQCRDGINRQKRDGLIHVEWNQEAAAVVWAMDSAQIDNFRWNLVTDLASRFRFELTTNSELPAALIANQLTNLFEQHGAPLVLKRDNGSNLCAPAVNEVLDAFGVIPLNSPLHYPRFNGSVEYAQRELKACAAALVGQGTPLDAAIEIAPHLINARPRPVLGGRTATEVFFAARSMFQQQFTLEKRKEIKNSIEENADCIRDRMKTCGHHAHAAAWRQAMEEWLVNSGVITVLQPKIVSPHFL